jgi:hypothetical protein
MSKVSQALYGLAIVAAFGLAWVMVSSGPNAAVGQPPATQEAPEPAPPADQVYTGAKRCQSCHFKQYTTWKKTKHSEAFNNLPKKYSSVADPTCMQCHSTGYAAKGGYAAGTDPAVLQNLIGVTCEACHGPGSAHEAAAKPLINVKKLSPEQEKTVRDTIWKVQPNVCIRCHAIQTHKEHPKYDKE